MKVEDLKGSKILLIGGTGFIGRYILKRLVSYGARLTVVSLFRDGEYNGPELDSCIKIKGSILDRDVQNRIAEDKYDYVINTGGYINQRIDKETEKEMMLQHFESVRILVDLAGRNLKRFIQTGSAVEYGDNPIPHREDMRERPLNPYAAAKVAATHYLQMLYRCYNFPVVILRPFFVYGRGQDRNKFIPYVIEMAKQDKDIEITSGEQLRDPIYVEDVAEAYIRSMIVDGLEGEVINVGSGRGMKIREIAEIIVSMIGKGRLKIGSLPSRKGDILNSVADNRKLTLNLNIDVTNFNKGLRIII
jgi:nucleoside-diphosphate-sugar epimerase